MLACVQASSTDVAAPAERLAAQLLELWARLMRHSGAGVFELVEELELSITQLKALNVLDRCVAELSVKELSQALGLSLPGASRTAEGLLRRGLLERREDEADRRIKRVRITDSGRDIVRRIETARLQGLQAWAATLSDAHRDALLSALGPLLSDLQEVPA
jgi:DNA-binding MarR family transcriptional regulator